VRRSAVAALHSDEDEGSAKPPPHKVDDVGHLDGGANVLGLLHDVEVDLLGVLALLVLPGGAAGVQVVLLLGDAAPQVVLHHPDLQGAHTIVHDKVDQNESLTCAIKILK
jgi:hypothetical protein